MEGWLRQGIVVYEKKMLPQETDHMGKEMYYLPCNFHISEWVPGGRVDSTARE